MYPVAPQPDMPLAEVQRCLYHTERPVLLDIGAGWGDHAKRFVESCAATVHVFEPDPRNAFKCRELLAAHLRAGQCHFYQVAVGNHTGTRRFHLSSGSDSRRKDWSLSSSLLPNGPGNRKFHPWLKFEQVIEVDATTLDDWARERSLLKTSFDFVWMDVQGAEGEVFQGAREVLPNCRWLYFEFSDHACYEGQPNLAKLLPMLPGFTVVRIYGHPEHGNILLRNNRF